MAYATSNPPSLLSQLITGKGLWVYQSADAVADVNTDGYITDAEDLGMKAQDIVFVTDTDTGATHLCIVAAINANGSADLTDGTAIDNTDSD